MQHASGADELVDALTGEGPFTVFAPNNGAFEKIEDKLAELMKPGKEKELQKLLMRHVVKEKEITSNSIKGNTKEKTVGGEEINVAKAVVVNSKIVRIKSSAGEAKVIKPDVMAGNGVIHIVDSAL